MSLGLLNTGSTWIWRCKMVSFEAILRQSTVSKKYDYYKNQFYCVICWRYFVMFLGKGVGATPFDHDPSMGGFQFDWFKSISCLYYFLESEFKVSAQAPSLRDFPSAPTKGSLVTPGNEKFFFNRPQDLPYNIIQNYIPQRLHNTYVSGAGQIFM